MRLDPHRIKDLCRLEGLTLQGLLQEAGVSRTAYYSLTRKDSVLPQSVRSLAGTLGVAPSSILDEPPPRVWRARALLRQAQRIVAQDPSIAFEDAWHSLMLLEEPPIERLRRSLLRGRAADLH